MKATRSCSDDDKDMPVEERKDKNVDGNVESMSSESDAGKAGGSGLSGEGYSADCSSSDTSSLEAAAKGIIPNKEMQRMSVDDDKKKNSVDKTQSKPSKSSIASATASQDGSDSSLSTSLIDEKPRNGHERRIAPASEGNFGASAPQWNGIRINHPMDPRIDLSTVGHIQTSFLSSEFPTVIHNQIQQDINQKNPMHRSQQDIDRRNPMQGNSNGGEHTAPAQPSLDQYMKLMEVVRPFFHAHGFSNGIGQPSSEDATERPSSGFATGASESGGEIKSFNEGRKLEVPTSAWNTAQQTNASDRRIVNKDAHASDTSSLVVLAPGKRKKTRKSSGNQASEAAKSSTNKRENGGLNGSSSPNNKEDDVKNADALTAAQSPARDESGDEDHDDGNDNAQPDPADQQESASSSSSEGLNNEVAARDNEAAAPEEQAVPPVYPGPAVVSEYSSSRTGGSGSSNSNQTSTSGSGSGGNTGSGTGSGSNQGGSSGSGNDNGGISSNGGNGSSGSGNDVKGSSENNSGGNSDEAFSTKKVAKTSSNKPLNSPHMTSGHRHASETVQRQDDIPSMAGQDDQNATREKKIQDKKRKRMNMRREYEEKVEQEMESSESSNGREEVVIKPGRPITLDKVLSFTKVPRIVVKAGPPFYIVYTNAAYSRLSSIDSHMAVGKPLSSLLSIIDQNHSSGQISSVTRSTDNTSEQNRPVHVGHPSGSIQNYPAVETAGRMRAVTAEENSGMGLERLVAASGYGRYHAINVLSKNKSRVDVSNPSATVNRKKCEDFCNGSGITSSQDEQYVFVTCSMSVSPIVSSPEALDVSVVTDKDQDTHHHISKRRKHQHLGESQQSLPAGSHQHRRCQTMREHSAPKKRQLITHFVIQLGQVDDKTGQMGGNSSESVTSTSAEAHMFGTTKSEVRSLRKRRSSPSIELMENNNPVDEGYDEEVESESTDPKEAVTAIG
eukprot:scaffold5799_cov110-Cylindrotheca_fusiformis.AAC.7